VWGLQWVDPVMSKGGGNHRGWHGPALSARLGQKRRYLQGWYSQQQLGCGRHKHFQQALDKNVYHFFLFLKLLCTLVSFLTMWSTCVGLWSVYHPHSTLTVLCVCAGDQGRCCHCWSQLQALYERAYLCVRCRQEVATGGKNVLIFDLGGGTFDVSLLTIVHPMVQTLPSDFFNGKELCKSFNPTSLPPLPLRTVIRSVPLVRRTFSSSTLVEARLMCLTKLNQTVQSAESNQTELN
jgi:hypothetical protein